MPKPKDRVQLTKQESANQGGDPADVVEYLNDPLDPQEDAPDLAGLYVQESGVSNDRTVSLYRESNELYFEDATHSGLDRVNLTELNNKKLKISSEDTTAEYLYESITADGLDVSITNSGLNEGLNFSLSVDDPGPFRDSPPLGAFSTTGFARKVPSANGYSSIEFRQNQTDWAGISIYWKRGPTTSVTIRIKFQLKQVGSGSNVRIVARVKARADTEDTSTAWDNESVDVVSISGKSVGEVISSELILSPAIFSNEDAVAIQIGRDGAEEIAGGSSDDFNKAIQFIAFEYEVQ